MTLPSSARQDGVRLINRVTGSSELQPHHALYTILVLRHAQPRASTHGPESHRDTGGPLHDRNPFSAAIVEICFSGLAIHHRALDPQAPVEVEAERLQWHLASRDNQLEVRARNA